MAWATWLARACACSGPSGLFCVLCSCVWPFRALSACDPPPLDCPVQRLELDIMLRRVSCHSMPPRSLPSQKARAVLLSLEEVALAPPPRSEHRWSRFKSPKFIGIFRPPPSAGALTQMLQHRNTLDKTTIAHAHK